MAALPVIVVSQDEHLTLMIETNAPGHDQAIPVWQITGVNPPTTWRIAES